MSSGKRYKNLQLAQLRSFCLAATQGNFSTAARALGSSVPTVWQQVRSLERKLGVDLLYRSGRLLEVTPEGQLLLELVQPHVNGLDSLRRLFEARRAELPRQLTIVSTYYLLSYHLPPALLDFRAAHPSVRLHLRGGPWPDVIRQVEQREADVGVVSCAADGPRGQQMEYEQLFDLYFTLLTSPGHPLTRKRRLTAHDLVPYPLLVSGRETFSRQTLESLLRRHELDGQVHRVMESPTTDLMHRYVAHGLGIALTYVADGAERLMPDLGVRVFDRRLDPLPVYLVSRKGDHLPEFVEGFRATIRRLLTGHTKPGAEA